MPIAENHWPVHDVLAGDEFFITKIQNGFVD